jgi:hypothetical protein
MPSPSRKDKGCDQTGCLPANSQGQHRVFDIEFRRCLKSKAYQPGTTKNAELPSPAFPNIGPVPVVYAPYVTVSYFLFFCLVISQVPVGWRGCAAIECRGWHRFEHNKVVTGKEPVVPRRNEVLGSRIHDYKHSTVQSFGKGLRADGEC